LVADIRIGIESIVRASASELVCVVRCLAGPVSTGDTFDTATFADGTQASVELRTATILRYGQSTDLLDPPHAAQLELVGAGADSLTGTRTLSGTGRMNPAAPSD